MPQYVICNLTSCILGLLFVEGVVATDNKPSLTSHSENQHEFLVAKHSFAIGKYPDAIYHLQRLSQNTNSIRVKLELARAYFFNKNYKKSKRLFKQILKTPTLPFSVRQKVNIFLKRIDQKLGYVKYSAAIAYDDNPRQFTYKNDTLIGGQRFTILQPEDNKTVWGLKHNISAFKPVSKNFRLFTNLTFSDFPNSNFDRFEGTAGIMQKIPNTNFDTKFAIEATTYADHRNYTYPYFSLSHKKFTGEGNLLENRLTFGKLNVKNFSYLDATNVNLLSRYTHKTKNKHLLGAELFLETSKTDEEPYSYNGAYIGSSLTYNLKKPNLTLKLSALVGKRKYKADEPFFGITREDEKYKIGLGFTPKNWVFFNKYQPDFMLYLEKTDSNINFYTYEKVYFDLTINY